MLRTIGSLSIVVLACSSLACTKPTSQREAEAKAKTEAKTEAEAKTEKSDPGETAKPEAAKPETPEPNTPTAAAVEVEAKPPVQVEPDTIAISPVDPIEARTPWREAAMPGEPITFVNLTGGVLAEGAAGYYDVDDTGALVQRPEIESPDGQIIGYWPKNAWSIETRSKIIESERDDEELREIRLMRLRGERRWVPQDYGGEQRFADYGQDFRVGGKGGMLVWEDPTFTRVADTGSDPDETVYRGSLVEFVETRSGRLYTISRDGEELFAQRNCPDQACVDESAVKLPFGVDWSFSLEVPRQRHSVSLAANVRHEDADKAHLMHYETGGWKLEALPTSASGLWPTKDGGLWARVGDKLLHRDPDGGWRNIVLPPGAGNVSVAMRADQSELWIAAVVDGKPAVFATHANAQELPPEQPSLELQAG
jgi:hypothetical protein